jgi:UDPglucose--hexose-1-phosphate uridylyltransferase
MKARIVAENEAFVAVVPFWAAWPYEVLVVPRRHTADITELSLPDRTALAHMLRTVTVRYDNLHFSPFPYAMAMHQRPTGKAAGSAEQWHFHIHFLPPMARNATARRFTGAFELLFMQKRDSTPEETARKLRSCSEEHFTKHSSASSGTNPSTASAGSATPGSGTDG